MSDYEASMKQWKEDMADEAHYGCDLDATLAEHNGWKGPLHIGKPIPKMVERIKQHLANGERVKIFTARYSEPDLDIRKAIVEAIQDWTEKHIGQRLEVTNEKTYSMIGFYDDRAIQVVPNTGERVDGQE